ncbi:MAG TPA: RNA polymerase sigma-70 factor [Niabella sp.]
MKLEEIALIERFKKGDALAYARLYDLYHARLYTFIIRFVKIPETAEDILQEVFLKLWNIRERVDSAQSLQAYLYKITRNQVFNCLKKSIRQKEIIDYVQRTTKMQTIAGEEQLRWREYETILSDAIDCLPVQRKKVFQLCRDEGKTYDGVARELGISKNTVKEHMVLATRAIRSYVRKHIDLRSMSLLLLLFFPKD